MDQFPTCRKPIDFSAEGGHDEYGVSFWDTQNKPRDDRAQLRDGKLKVNIRVGEHHVKVRNRSPFAVRFEYSIRCPVG